MLALTTLCPMLLDTMVKTDPTQINASHGTTSGGTAEPVPIQFTLFAVFLSAPHAISSNLTPPSASPGMVSGGKDMLPPPQLPPFAVSIPALHANASPGTT